MGEIRDIFVDFDAFCPSCKYVERASIDYPCDDCLDHPVNQQSRKPVYYEEAKKDEAVRVQTTG